jgi:dolichyl-phosphate beta-glucosyltransferase
MITSISFVFPLYNESKRLENLCNQITKFIFENTNLNYEIIFVNDGSKDGTSKIIKNYKSNLNSKLKIINYKKNRGKGHAIKKGVLRSKKDWILTLDADLSVNMNQLFYWNRKYKLKKNIAYFGSRNLKNSIVSKKFYRFIFGYLLNLVLFKILNIKITDTQCGFKLYNRKYALKIFKELKIYDFSHDIEIIYLLKKYQVYIKELPVTWIHVGGSKVRLFYDSFKFIFNILNYYIPKFKKLKN